MAKRQRALTKAELARKQSYEQTRVDLEAKGFHSHPLLISILAANLWAFALSLPIIVALGIGFFALHPSGGESLGTWGLVIVSLSFLLLIVVHEGIHGLTWGAFAKGGWRSVSFGVVWQCLTPYCTCSEPLSKHAYLIGALAPTVVLGLLPVLVSYATGSLIWFGVGALMILGGGGDLAIVLKLLLFKPDGDEVLYLDHPYECGLVAFVRQGKRRGVPRRILLSKSKAGTGAIMEKLPPLAKVFEAWSALADGRVALDADGRRATVTSSNGERAYTVAWSEDGGTYSSNDNATYWQGYAGYPVIAVLMGQGRLPFDRAVAEGFAHVDWTALNERHKRDYMAAVREVVEERGLDAAQVESAACEAMDALAALDVAVKRSSARPPKTKKA